MADSAFGVDHGEISKADTIGPGAARRIGRGLGRLKRLGDKAANAQISISGVGVQAGKGVQATGRGLTRGGQALKNHPGLTGTGIGAAGLGGGYAAHRRGKKKK